MIRKTLFVAASIALTPVAWGNAVLVESFEDRTPGELQTRTGATFVDAATGAGADPSAGITDGDLAVQFLATGGAGFELVDIFRLTGVTGPIESITYDIYQEDLNAGPVGNRFFQFVAGVDLVDDGQEFTFSGDYQQINGVKLSDDPTGQSGNSFVGDGTGSNTIYFDATQNGGANAGVFADINAVLANGGPVDFTLVLNKSSEATGIVRIDNVIVNEVPEPASAALLASGVALLAARRRRA